MYIFRIVFWEKSTNQSEVSHLMPFIADLHIHSKYSRATARNLDLENLYMAARIKGLSVVGTGDFTHPDWMAELSDKLVQTEPGLYALKPEITRELDAMVPGACQGEVRFILQAEISNIYKKDGRVRKNHNLIYLPDLDIAKAFNARLDAIGNIKSDGRPILGLDARDLLEIMLDTSDKGFFVPAHIWTPWFSMFGSKSGFDTIEACFGDLSAHIFACETGLSSDPPMNWRVKDLDRVRLISNSDAHSPGFLGRNASVFDTEFSFESIKNALKTGDLSAFHGTLDMYPDQGKYHYDGHRKCNVRLNPDETAALEGICPVCGKPLTLGVLYRVRELAGRPEGFQALGRHPFSYVVPLADVLSEIFGVGPKTKKVTGFYNKAIEALGPELYILTRAGLDEIETAGVPLLGRAIEKMRQGDLYIEPGYDGEYGKVRLFTKEEKQTLQGEKGLGLTLKSRPGKKQAAPKKAKKSESRGNAGGKTRPKTLLRKTAAVPDEARPEPPKDILAGLNTEQKAAVQSLSRAVLIQAGPGTGKTRTLTARIAWLLKEKQADPGGILALTFTNKAARELEERIASFQTTPGVMAATFHSFCLTLLRTATGFERGLMDDALRLETLEQAAARAGGSGKQPGKRRIRRLDHLIGLAKQQLLGPEDDLSGLADDPDLAGVYKAYEALCAAQGTADFEDLIYLAYKAMAGDADLLDTVRTRVSHLFVDEYQDLNRGQYELVRLLAQQARLFVIGDPDQSIYGFRGSDNRFFKRFEVDFPGCEQIRLRQNYRSTQTILDASFQMISTPEAGKAEERRIYASFNTSRKLVIREAGSAPAEAVAVGKMIESLVGGLSMLSMDTGAGGQQDYSFADFAVLYRTRAQCEAFAAAFDKAGIPFQTADREKWQTIPGIQGALALLNKAAGRLVGDGMAAALEKNELTGMDPIAWDCLDSPSLLDCIGHLLDMEAKARENADTRWAWQNMVTLAGLNSDPADFLDRLALNRDADLLVPGVEKVSLMTMHAAKGLEFPVVFVTGCETGMIPYARDMKTVEDEAEERRLFYVAMTRAMDILCLTYARKRRIYGLEKQQERSYFIDDIERELARFDRIAAKQPPKKTQVQLELF
jgi:DNA helicase-2/ATP-dependent DNA helicase PcrA